LRFCGLKVLVGNVDLQFQGVQLRVIEYFPPIATETLFAGLSSLPVADFFIARWNFDRRPMIFRTYGTTSEQKRASETNGRDPIFPDSILGG
jgi:hypothetical protein